VQRQIAPSPAQPGSRARWSDRRDLDKLEAFFDEFAREEPRWRRRNRTYYRLIESLMRFAVPPGASVLELGCASSTCPSATRPAATAGRTSRVSSTAGCSRR